MIVKKDLIYYYYIFVGVEFLFRYRYYLYPRNYDIRNINYISAFNLKIIV